MCTTVSSPAQGLQMVEPLETNICQIWGNCSLNDARLAQSRTCNSQHCLCSAQARKPASFAAERGKIDPGKPEVSHTNCMLFLYKITYDRVHALAWSLTGNVLCGVCANRTGVASQHDFLWLLLDACCWYVRVVELSISDTDLLIPSVANYYKWNIK